MTKIYRSNPARLREPGLSDAIVVDTVRGKVRVRKWPAKRGRPKSPAVRAQNEWFKEANRLAKVGSTQQIKAAMVATKGSGLYPRDILLRSMAGNLGPFRFDDGALVQKRRLEFPDMTFQGAVLNLAVNTSLSGGTVNYVTWPLPVIDTASFWDVSNPTRITIPSLAAVVQITCQALTVSGDSTSLRGFIRQNGTTFVGHQQCDSAATAGLSMTLGPFVPVVGDYFEFGILPNNTDTFVAGIATGFNIQVLETQ